MFEADKLMYQSTLGSRVIQRKKKRISGVIELHRTPSRLEYRLDKLQFRPVATVWSKVVHKHSHKDIEHLGR